jgi:inorganic pyrophosphatase
MLWGERRRRVDARTGPHRSGDLLGGNAFLAAPIDLALDGAPSAVVSLNLELAANSGCSGARAKAAIVTRFARHTILSEIATFDETGDLRVVVETPKGSRNKYDYNPDCDCFDLATVLPEGMTFPYDFGFVPSTIGQDGDPLDVLVLMDAPGVPGCIVRAKLVGAIRARQREKKGKGKWTRNDRLLAVATHVQTHERVRSLRDLRPHLVEEIKAFFVEYNGQRGRKFEPQSECGPAKALKLVRAGRQTFKKKNGKRRGHSGG